MIPGPLALLAGMTRGMSPKEALGAVAKTHHTFQLILNLGCDRIAVGISGVLSSWCPRIRCAPGLWVQKCKSLNNFYREIRRAKLKCRVASTRVETAGWLEVLCTYGM